MPGPNKTKRDSHGNSHVQHRKTLHTHPLTLRLSPAAINAPAECCIDNTIKIASDSKTVPGLQFGPGGREKVCQGAQENVLELESGRAKATANQRSENPA